MDDTAVSTWVQHGLERARELAGAGGAVSSVCGLSVSLCALRVSAVSASACVCPCENIIYRPYIWTPPKPRVAPRVRRSGGSAELAATAAPQPPAPGAGTARRR